MFMYENIVSKNVNLVVYLAYVATEDILYLNVATKIYIKQRELRGWYQYNVRVYFWDNVEYIMIIQIVLSISIIENRHAEAIPIYPHHIILWNHDSETWRDGFPVVIGAKLRHYIVCYYCIL